MVRKSLLCMALHKFQRAKPRSPHALWPLITGGCQGADGGASGICRSSPWKGMTSCRVGRAQKAATKQLPSGSKGLENTQLSSLGRNKPLQVCQHSPKQPAWADSGVSSLEVTFPQEGHRILGAGGIHLFIYLPPPPPILTPTSPRTRVASPLRS